MPTRSCRRTGIRRARSASASRAQGNFTGVDGENIVFGPGDMVLTPERHLAQSRHRRRRAGAQSFGARSAAGRDAQRHPFRARLHGGGRRQARCRRSSRPRALPSDYSQRIYGYGGLLPRFAGKQKRGAGFSSPMFVYRWEMMRELLERHKDWDGDPHDALMVEYIDPTTGQPVFKTITFFVQMLRPGERTLPVRQTASLLVAPFEGNGPFDRRRPALRLERSSTRSPSRAAPGASMSTAPTRSRSVLFVASDEPTLKKLDLYKKWGRTKDDARGPPGLMQPWSPRRGPQPATVSPATMKVSFAVSVQHHACLAYRLPRRRPGLGRRHDALCRPHAPDRAARRSSMWPTRSNPRLLARIDMPEGWHSHKVRVADDIMIVNHEKFGKAARGDFGGGHRHLRRVAAERAEADHQMADRRRAACIASISTAATPTSRRRSRATSATS